MEIEVPSKKFDKLINIIKELEDQDQLKILENTLRTKLEINKLQEALEMAEQRLLDNKEVIYYFLAMSLTNDEINFSLEKLNSIKKRIIKEEEQKSSEENNEEA
jgi:hypothetical protein